MTTNVVDLVTEKVMETIGDQIEARAVQAAADAKAAAERQIGEWLKSNAPTPVPAVDGKADAKNRATRTVIQGAISTVVVAVLLAIVGVIGGDGFDFTTAADWKAVGGAAVGAVVMTVTAYLHRIISPPGGSGDG